MHRIKWFVTGVVIGVLLLSTLNSLSYFVRSSSWSGLVGKDASGQALGFPFEIWRYGQTYGTAMHDQTAMSWNAAVALTLGAVFGLLGAYNSTWLTRFTDSMAEAESREQTKNTMQFSIRGMFLLTSASAIIVALIRSSIGARPELLWAIYILGPLFLVAMAMIPKGMSWQYRLILLTPSTLILVGFSIYIGNRLGLEFDRVMFGVFVCWVPQTVIAAGCLTLSLALRYSHEARTS